MSYVCWVYMYYVMRIDLDPAALGLPNLTFHKKRLTI